LSQRDWRDPGFAQDDSHPVVCVSHADARAYAAWLSARTGSTYRLPTAAEWRRISAGQPARGCRDGNVRDRSEGGGDRYDCRDGHAETAPASGPATGPYAIAGLVGNVREWLADCRERGAGNDCDERAVAGSSWRSGTGDALLGVDGEDGGRGWTDVGFRVVREVGTDGPPPRAP
jgi:formylglycine-generating enzyme required for sulfatase activity